MTALCPCGTPAESGKCPECLEYEADQRGQRLERRVLNSGLPTALRGTKLPDDQLGQVAAKWVAGEFSTLVLTGAVGVGKTYLAAGATWAFLQSRPIHWVSVARMMLQLRASFGDDDRAKALKVLTGTGPLVLDDLDKVNPTEDGRASVFTAIDTRIEEQAPLLVTTNLELTEIGKRYGDPVMSRLRSGHVVKMTGPDRRLA